ncbi:murein hydrolase activator EnvC family protein [Leifsonia sp. NPDC058248]|uniref:murein hydrolase activator EnvC family protein n=1 Tax=Leifsonia sp. NPDC058248 TaxID=3346402 RepID=UPI0036DEFE70
MSGSAVRRGWRRWRRWRWGVVMLVGVVGLVGSGGGGVEVVPAVGAAPGARWLWPIAPPSLSRGFEAPPTPYAAGHRGIDLRAAPGSPVAAPSGATVRFTGVVVDRPVLTLDHGGGVLSSYEPVATELSVGDVVAAGAALGTVATGGHCAAVCLHIGVRVDGEYVSPLLFFDRVPRAVLLPLGGA